jgi:hypothetical protein
VNTVPLFIDSGSIVTDLDDFGPNPSLIRPLEQTGSGYCSMPVPHELRIKFFAARNNFLNYRYRYSLYRYLLCSVKCTYRYLYFFEFTILFHTNKVISTCVSICNHKSRSSFKIPGPHLDPDPTKKVRIRRPATLMDAWRMVLVDPSSEPCEDCMTLV